MYVDKGGKKLKNGDDVLALIEDIEDILEEEREVKNEQAEYYTSDDSNRYDHNDNDDDGEDDSQKNMCRKPGLLPL